MGSGCESEQGKKFVKPEFKACIEEFKEKLNKFLMEKKEQEETARNAQVHIEKAKNMESLVATSKVKEVLVEEYDEDEDALDRLNQILSEVVPPILIP